MDLSSFMDSSGGGGGSGGAAPVASSATSGVSFGSSSLPGSASLWAVGALVLGLVIVAAMFLKD